MLGSPATPLPRPLPQFGILDTSARELSRATFGTQEEAEAMRDEWNDAYKLEFQTWEVIQFTVLPRETKEA